MSMNVESVAVQPWRFPVGDFIALAKPRLNVLVVATAAVGYWLGAARGSDAAARGGARSRKTGEHEIVAD